MREPKFKFPVYNKNCDNCIRRFECLSSNKLHFELPWDRDVIGKGKRWGTYLPFPLGVDCIKVEPIWRVTRIQTHRSGYGTEVSVDWQ